MEISISILDVDKGIAQKIMRVNQRKILHKKIAVKAKAFWKIPILTYFLASSFFSRLKY